MINRNWKRVTLGACTAAALVVGAGLAFAPAANAATTTDPTTGLLGGVTSGVTGIVSGLLGGTTTAPVTVGTGSGGVTVGVGGTTVGVTTGTGIGVTVGTSNGSGAAVTLGGTTTGLGGTVAVSGGSGTTGTPATPSPVTLSAIMATSQYATVYPAKDGYRDTDAFTLSGTASDGQQHAASGTATLTFGSSTVTTWPITSTDQRITWNGLKGGKIVPGRYLFTATIGDSAGDWVSSDVAVDVSAKKLTTTTSLLTTRSVSGTHTMAAKPLAGLARGKVTLRITSVASHVKGKQYLVFTHAGKHLKVRIRNGKHTSAKVTVPKSFTSYTISHTWKKGTVHIKSLKYHYTYKSLK